MIKPYDTYFQTMTPEIAAAWLEQYRFTKQRPIRKWRIAQHVKSMQEQTWIPGYPMQVCLLGKDRICTDGQHRQWAVVESELTQIFNVVELHCDTMEEVEFVYYKTDRNIPRTVNDLYRSTSLDEELGLTSQQVSRLGFAISTLGTNFQRVERASKMITDEQRLMMIRRYGEAAGVYYETVAPAPGFLRGPLLRAPVIAVALATIDEAVRAFDTDTVTGFWHGVANDDGLRNDDPRKVARTHLLTSNLGHGRGVSGRQVTPEYQARYLANCFNAWVEGRKITGTKVHNDNGAILIKGTSFDGKKQEAAKTN